jgi:hypothetical protein
MNSSCVRRALTSLFVLFISIALTGCPSGSSSSSSSSSSGASSSKSLDGVYHGVTGGPLTITIKDNKATVQIAGDTKTLDYKVEGKKLTILNPTEGNIEFTINDDGTLSGQLGEMKKG